MEIEFEQPEAPETTAQPQTDGAEEFLRITQEESAKPIDTIEPEAIEEVQPEEKIIDEVVNDATSKENEKDFTLESRFAISSLDIFGAKILQAIAASESDEKYRIKESDHEHLVQLTNEVLKKYERIPPEFFLIASLLAIYVPAVFTAASERKKNKKQKTPPLQKPPVKIVKADERKEAPEKPKQKKQKKATTQRGRFQLDEKGFYIHSVGGTYLPKNKRTERPSLADIDLLYKVNDRELVNKIFNIQEEVKGE